MANPRTPRQGLECSRGWSTSKRKDNARAQYKRTCWRKVLENELVADLIGEVTPSHLKDGQTSKFSEHLQEACQSDDYIAPQYLYTS